MSLQGMFLLVQDGQTEIAGAGVGSISLEWNGSYEYGCGWELTDRNRS